MAGNQVDLLANFSAAGVALIAKTLVAKGLLDEEIFTHLRQYLVPLRQGLVQPTPEFLQLLDQIEDTLSPATLQSPSSLLQ